MTPPRTQRQRDDAGAVAIIIALSTVLLFGCAALSVDLGNAWARKRASQSQSDLAALAGGQLLPKGDSANQLLIANEVADYLNKNKISSDQPTAVGSDLLASGAVEFPSETQLQVTAPASKVSFGLAAALGASDRMISTSATVEKRALDPTPDKVLPMWLPSSCVYGPVEGDTDTDTTPPASSPAYNPASQGFAEDNNLRVVNLSVNTAQFGSTGTGSIDVTLENSSNTEIGNPTTPNKGAIVFTFGPPTSWSPPTTVYPVNLDVPGKATGTPGQQVVTISGVGPEVTSTVGQWEVWAVKNVDPSTKIPTPTGTSASVFSADEGSNKTSVDPAQDDPALFTVTGGGGEVGCDDSERGNFGQLDSPRTGVTNLQKAYGYNLALGMDHKLDRFDPSVALGGGRDLNLDPECTSDGNPTGAKIDNVVRDGNNCIYVQSGNDPPFLTAGLLSGMSGGPDGTVEGRLFSEDTSDLCSSTEAAPVKANDGHFNWSQINRDTLSCFLKDGATLEDIAKDGRRLRPRRRGHQGIAAVLLCPGRLLAGSSRQEVHRHQAVRPCVPHRRNPDLRSNGRQRRADERRRHPDLCGPGFRLQRQRHPRRSQRRGLRMVRRRATSHPPDRLTASVVEIYPLRPCPPCVPCPAVGLRALAQRCSSGLRERADRHRQVLAHLGARLSHHPDRLADGAVPAVLPVADVLAGVPETPEQAVRGLPRLSCPGLAGPVVQRTEQLGGLLRHRPHAAGSLCVPSGPSLLVARVMPRPRWRNGPGARPRARLLPRCPVGAAPTAAP